MAEATTTEQVNHLNGMRVIALTSDAVYLRVPEALQVRSAFADDRCTCGRCDGSGRWDTLAVPLDMKKEAWTVHMPDGAIQPFLDRYGKATGR